MNTFTHLAAEGASSGIMDWVDLISGKLGPAGKYIAALVIFLVGKWIAKRIGNMVGKGLGKTDFDTKVASKLGLKSEGIEKGVSSFVYYLLLLFILMIALNVAGMNDAVEPLKAMFTKFMGYIPNLIAGGIVLFLVLMIAKIVKNLLAGVMSGAKVDERLGMMDGAPVTTAATNGVYYFIILIMLPAILAIFNIPGITEPVTDMVKKITDNIPNVVSGLILIGIGYLIASVVQKLIYNLLNAANVNSFPAKMGFKGNMDKSGTKSPSGIISMLVMITIMVTVVTQALGLMNLGFISDLGQNFLGGYFHILGAVIVLGIAIFIANLVHSNLSGHNALLANIAKWGILIFAGFMALSMTGISKNITETPFMALVIAAAFALGVGGAIAIGLGGHPAVGRWMDKKIK